jgi:DNA-binding NarL/FixJ family response regulator
MSGKEGAIRAMVVDDSHFFRTFFTKGLGQVPGLSVMEAGTAEETLKLAASFCPHVIILNVSMHGCSGMALLQSTHRAFPQIGLLVFSCLHHDHLCAERAICAGAAGYISMDEPGEDLIKAVETVAAGGVYLNDTLRKKLCVDSGVVGRQAGSSFERLSPREFEVFCLTGHGYVPKRIADKLKVSVKTIETYRERIREKLGLADGGDLLYHAMSYMQEQRIPLAGER